MKKLFSIVAAMIALVGPAQAQQQTSVKVDGKDYTVTDYQFGSRSPTHMVSLSGPNLSGPNSMAMVNADTNDKITAIIYPSGGQLNGVDYRALINQVWAAYQAQKTGTASSPPTGQPTPVNGTDPNAALRKQNADGTARLQRSKWSTSR